MNFEESLNQGCAKNVLINSIRAKSLFESSKQAIETAKLIPLSENTAKTVLRESYEGLRQLCEAIGYLYGYKFLSHEVITYFLSDILNEKTISNKFDRYRKLRNGINYYGNSIELETVSDALKEISRIVSELKKYFK